MAFIRTYRPTTGGSGPASNLLWEKEVFEVTTYYDAGDLVLTLAHPIAQNDGLFLVSQGAPTYPVDFTIISPTEIQINFIVEPAFYGGTWSFLVQYQYEV